MREVKNYYDTVNGMAISLPTHIERDGFMLPLINANGEVRGDLENVGIMPMTEATPEAGKTITASHGEFIDGQYVEVIDEQLTADEIEAARVAALPPEAQQLRELLTGYGVDPNSTMEQLVTAMDDLDATDAEKAALEKQVTRLWLACATRGIKLGDL